jgi:hypothetical protein
MLNSPRIWMDREIEAFGRSLPEGSLVLDAGAGKQAYRSKFAHCRYEAADFEKHLRLRPEGDSGRGRTL